MIRKILLSGAALLAASASAFAADLPSRRAPPMYVAPPPIFTWTGFYLGGQIGYEWGAGSSSSSGVVGGAHLGYNYQISQFVFGLEGDVNGSSYNGSSFLPIRNAFASTKIPVDGSVRGRVGVAFDRALFYATGGVAFADIQDNFIGPAGIASVKHGRAGWTLGGGVEYAITNNWSVRGEYRYTDYGRFVDVSNALTIPLNRVSRDNRVQVGFSYKFDSFAPPAPTLAKY